MALSRLRGRCPYLTHISASSFFSSLCLSLCNVHSPVPALTMPPVCFPTLDAIPPNSFSQNTYFTVLPENILSSCCTFYPSLSALRSRRILFLFAPLFFFFGYSLIPTFPCYTPFVLTLFYPSFFLPPLRFSPIYFRHLAFHPLPSSPNTILLPRHC